MKAKLTAFMLVVVMILSTTVGADLSAPAPESAPEFSANHTVTLSVENGVIHLHNPTDTAVSAKGLYLTNDNNLRKWQIPSVIIRAGQTLRVRTGNDNVSPVLKRMAANFDLRSGETLRVSDVHGNVLSAVEVVMPDSDISHYSQVFGGEIISIDVHASEEDWQYLLDNAADKPWISVDVTINGEFFQSVGVRTKGSGSLVLAPKDRNKYSLNFRMDKFVEGQTYYGLDRFCVNNMFGDASYMKDFISYDLMHFVGAAAPLTSYANINVNGEQYIFGIAIERYHKSFLNRVYGTDRGFLYTCQLTGGGSDLVYTDDEIGSYGALFNHAIFNRTSEEDNRRVITAIKNLNAQTDLEKYIDVDQVLRYLAAHNVVVNSDSYYCTTGNYYLYEHEGKIAILPWDYNTAFECLNSFNGGTYWSAAMVNFPIDTPVLYTRMEDRPLINALLKNDEYRKRYHGYLREIVEGYFESGLFEKTVRELDAQINDYVKNNNNPFYSYEQYKEGVEVVLTLGRLRALSIRGQLDGTIPSTASSQQANPSALISIDGVFFD